MKTILRLSLALLGLAAALPSHAAEFGIADISLIPDGTTATEVLQTDIKTLNGGVNVLPSSTVNDIYTITTYNFGTDSDAHFISRFNATGGQDRLGIEVQDTGLIQFVSSGDTTRTNVNLATDLAGTSVTVIMKQNYDPANNLTYGYVNSGQDTLMNVWVDPTFASVEGSGLTAGDMFTLWDSKDYGFYTHTIQNQSTPGTAGDSTITETVILAGTEATFPRALEYAVEGGPTASGTVSAYISTVAASPILVANDGSTASTITVTLTDSAGDPVAGKVVSLASDGDAAISPSSDTSDASGVVTFAVTSATDSVQKFTATNVTDSSMVLYQTASVTFEPVGTINPDDSTVVASLPDVPADGATTSTITVSLVNSIGAPVSGKTVTLTGDTGDASISPASATTDVNGQASFTVSSNVVGTEIFTASDVTGTPPPASVPLTQTVQVVFTETSPTPATLFHEPFDYAHGTNLSGQGGWTGGSNTAGAFAEVHDGTGSESWNGAFTGVTQSGNYVGESKTPNPDADHVYAGKALDPSVTATFTDGAVTWLSFIAFEKTQVAIGADVLVSRGERANGQCIGAGGVFNNNSVRAHYWDDEDSNGTFEDHPSLTTLGSANPAFVIARIVWSDGGADSITVVRFSSGATISEAEFNLAPQSTISADLDQSLFDTVSFAGSNEYVDEIRIATTFDQAVNGTLSSGPGPIDVTQSTAEAADATVPADGTSTTTITVTLRDSSGVGIPGEEVTLSNSGSANIGPTASIITDSSGEAIFTVSSSTAAFEDFEATVVISGSPVIIDIATVEFQEVVTVGPVDAGNSTVVADPTSVIANGVSTSTITVTLKDSNAQLIVGEGVTLSGSPANATIIPAGTVSTDANGEAEFTVSSSTIGLVVFSATSSTDNTTITQTASVDFTDPQLSEAFNVTFLDEGQTEVTGLIGVVGSLGETWNQGIGTTGSPVSNLVDTTGTIVSSVSVSGLGDDGRTLSSADLTIFNGTRNIFGKGDDVTLSITGLTPDAAYDLYIYSLSHNASPWGDIANSERAAGDFVTANTVLGNGQSQFLDNGISTTSDDVFVPNGNYVAFESIVADGSGNISILVDAYDGDGDRGTSSTRLHVSGLQIRPASGMSVDYMNWSSTYYPGLGLPGEDDDGDGLSNDYERIYGLDPTDAGSIRPIVTTLDPGNGIFSYTRRAQALANLNFRIWYSTDLVQWFVDNAASQVVQSTTNGVELVNVTIDPTLLTETKLFVQVRTSAVTGVDIEPELLNLWGDGSTVTLLFSEPMNQASAENPDNYTVTQDGVGPITVTNATLSPDGGSVTLDLASSLGLATGYTVNIDGVTSGTGESLGSNVSRQFTTWDDNPNGIKVFILAGQSNMVGFGETERGNGDVDGAIGSLRYRVLNNASFPDFDYTSLLVDPLDTSSAYRTRSDVRVWYRDGGNGNLGGAILEGELGPPFMGRDTGKIGPEFAFGQIMGDFYATNNVLIIKCAWGGRDLAENFRPPSAVADRGGQVGDFYNAIIDYSREVLNDLDNQIPSWAGQGYEIVGFGWHQGYNDRINSTFSAEYKDNLPDLIEDLREVFNKPDLPFVIASTGMGGLTPIETGPYPSYTDVERAQLWDAGVTQPADVLSTDTRPFWREVADSPTDQGFHWNQNGETYFMIGQAMGEDMVNLLTP